MEDLLEERGSSGDTKRWTHEVEKEGRREKRA
jgi:hypothetical protein